MQGLSEVARPPSGLIRMGNRLPVFFLMDLQAGAALSRIYLSH
jgi:hypothetical protein